MNEQKLRNVAHIAYSEGLIESEEMEMLVGIIEKYAADKRGPKVELVVTDERGYETRYPATPVGERISGGCKTETYVAKRVVRDESLWESYNETLDEKVREMMEYHE